MKILKTIAVQLFMGANIATVLLLWACCAVTYISPATAPRLSLLTLTFPAFLVVNAAFVLFWLIFKPRLTWLPLVGFAACFGFVRDYFPVNLPQEVPDDAMKVISFNAHYFGGRAVLDEDGKNPIAEYLAESNADLICLQEGGDKLSLRYRDRVAEAGYNMENSETNVYYSRLPILDVHTIDFPTRQNVGSYAHLLDGQDTILVINVHFESNHLSPDIRSAYKDALHNPQGDSLRKEIQPLVSMMATAAPLRAAQTDTVCALIEQWLPRPVILCCDMNDTPISYTHRRLTSLLDNAYRESATGLGVTYDDKGFPVRIDHIFYTPEHWSSHATYVERAVTWSDHYPLVTYLKRRRGGE